MKTVKNGETIKRVSDSEANSLIRSGWSYCPKSEWKEKVRGPIEQKKKSKKVDKRKASNKEAEKTA